MRASERRPLEAVFASVLGALALGAAGCWCPPPTTTTTLHPVAPSGESVAERMIDCERLCGGPDNCVQSQLPDGTLALSCSAGHGFHCAAGRRPRGLRVARAPRRARDASAGVLGSMAELEAASVFAFRGLADELALHGAPAALVRRARRAAIEEARHARVIGLHATRRGARVRAVHAAPPIARPLIDLAIENAREGCVLETFAALLAVHQSRAATDPVFRAAMGAVARDETSHAEIARDVDRWARTRLAPREVQRLDRAHGRAWARLEAVHASPDLPELGVPGGATLAKMAAALRAAMV